MAVSESYREYVMEQLEVIGSVQSRKMFGGVGIYLGDLFFALISKNTLFFKVDDITREEYIQAGMEAFKPYKDKPMTMGYYEVPVDVLEDRSEIEIWANKAVDVALRAKKGK